MHEIDYRSSHSTKSIGITLTTISTQKIRRSHAPDTVCLRQNIGYNILGPAYFPNSHTPIYSWHLTDRRSRAQDTTWDKHIKPLRWSEQQDDWFEWAHKYLPDKQKQRPIISTEHNDSKVEANCSQRHRHLPPNKHLCFHAKKKPRLDGLHKISLSTKTSRLESHSPRKPFTQTGKPFTQATTLLDKQNCKFTLITPPEKCTMFVEVDHSFIQTPWWTFQRSDMPSAQCLCPTASAQPVKGVGGMA